MHLAALSRTYALLFGMVRKIIAPPFCRSCKKFLNDYVILCEQCHNKVEPVATITLQVTKKKSIEVFAIGPYRDPLKYLIISKSWSDRTSAYQLGQLAWQATNIRLQDFDCIVPVPLHWYRQATRGFNQAEVMAQAMSNASGKPVVRLIKRVQATAFQYNFTAAGRLKNVKQAFHLDERLIDAWCSKRILIVDDLMTTGATLQSIGKIILPLSPTKIIALVAARVIG
jgi:ComF family protein